MQVQSHRYDTFMSTKNTPNAEIDKRIAYHQAGRAIAICLGNKERKLPPVYFSIVIKRLETEIRFNDRFAQPCGKYTAEIDGGRLIETLPACFVEATKDFSVAQRNEYQRAFEGDIINLLSGSIAEAKYVAIRDGELFNPNLINLEALHFYGGNSDLTVVHQYMSCFIADIAERKCKLIELYMRAFRFINHRGNWLAISALAESLLEGPKTMLGCEEISNFLAARKLCPSQV